tara:strand:- start:156 stop:833 length:678 start_codon:yes stop_codon:yes gene_type:complete
MIDKCSVASLKKAYHKLCLKYHPDKSKDDDLNYDSFLKVKECYEILLHYKEEHEETIPPDEDNAIYNYFLSLFNVSNLEKIMDWIETRTENNEIIYLHVSWSQVVSKDVYLHNGTYIPLWYNSLQHENEVYYIKVKDMPNHMKRNENNDLVVYCNQRINTLFQKGQCFLSIPITQQKKVRVPITQTVLKNGYYIALHQGIPRLCEENIYDISELSHVIVLFTKSP